MNIKKNNRLYLYPFYRYLWMQSNLVIRNFLVTLKLFLNAKCSLSLWSKLTIGHRKWFLNTNLFLIKTFLITKFDCTLLEENQMGELYLLCLSLQNIFDPIVHPLPTCCYRYTRLLQRKHCTRHCTFCNIM